MKTITMSYDEYQKETGVLKKQLEEKLIERECLREEFEEAREIIIEMNECMECEDGRKCNLRAEDFIEKTNPHKSAGAY